MNSFLLLLLATICSLALSYQVNEKEPTSPKLPLRPGDLLRSLDALISDAQVIYSPLQVTPPKLAERRVYHDDELSPKDNQESGSEYDYDKAYENFVKKYFAKGEEELNSGETNNDDEIEGEKAEDIDDDDEVAPYEFSDEFNDQPIEGDKSSPPSSSSSESKKCEHVKIDKQNCKICEDPVTNEKSKTCSYSSDDKPKSYGYSKERSSKRSSKADDDDDDDVEKSTEAGRSIKREVIYPNNNKKKFQPRKTSIEQFLKVSPSFDDDSSKCTRKLENGMICFYCGSITENTRECIADKNDSRKHRLDGSSKKDSATKKIFKRMVVYSVKNDSEPRIKENTYAAFKAY